MAASIASAAQSIVASVRATLYIALSRAITAGAAFAMIAMAWLALQGAPASADEGSNVAPPWFVAELQGTAFIRSSWDNSEGWQRLHLGARIEPGSIVRTDETGRLVLENGVDRIQVAANSQVELPTGRGGDPVTRVIHWVGSAFFEVGKRPAPQFEVTTPYLVAIVKGTKFTTEVSDAGAAVKVKEGLVGVSAAAGGASTDVTAGQSVSVSAAGDGAVTPGDLSGSAKPAGPDSGQSAEAGSTSSAPGGGSDEAAGAAGNPTARGATSRGGNGNGHDNSSSGGAAVAVGNGNGDGQGGDDDGGDGDGGDDDDGHDHGCPGNGGSHSFNGGRPQGPPHGNW